MLISATSNSCCPDYTYKNSCRMAVQERKLKVQDKLKIVNSNLKAKIRSQNNTQHLIFLMRLAIL